MENQDKDFLDQLLITFRLEAEEHTTTLSSGLVELEKAGPGQASAARLESIFREAHSLKGAARAVNLIDIEALCQSLEDVFAAWKRQEITPAPELFDVLHHAIDTVNFLLDGQPPEEPDRISQAQRQLTRLLAGRKDLKIPPRPANPQPATEAEPTLLSPRPTPIMRHERLPKNGPQARPSRIAASAIAKTQSPVGKRVAEEEPNPTQKSSQPETVRISIAKLDSILRRAEEMLTIKLTTRERTSDLQRLRSRFHLWNREWSKVFPEIQAIRRRLNPTERGNGNGQPTDQVGKLLVFLSWNQTYIASLQEQLASVIMSTLVDQRSLGGMVDHLVEDTKKLLMLPFSTIRDVFPKLVRDLSRKLGKEAELVFEGSEVEIDRRILEEMKDPLIHLVRNCIDHGIETPTERARHQKPTRGTVTIAISQVYGNKVEMTIADDGAGIDLEKVKAASVKRGIVSKPELDHLPKQQALSLIFQSEISTSAMITEISGRGLGLAIVREKVKNLGGSISVETNRHVGTVIRILLPLTLAMYRGILVRVEDQFFVILTTHVDHVVRIKLDDIKTVENRETIPLNEEIIPLVPLREVLNLSPGKEVTDRRKFIQALVIEAVNQRMAFGVDEVLHEQDVLVKNLGKQLARVRNIAGATVLGSGQVALVLNVTDLMQSVQRMAGTPTVTTPAPDEVDAERKSILVVDDSITSRTLLKNILQAVGYKVKTAVDGIEAHRMLKSEDVGLVVSDIEMPRMNGFELTAQIRSDPQLQDIPVVLVTTLDAPGDRERGFDAGANAYIVKMSFDQSNLLKAIQRLM